jgi:hypothetical protein
MSTAPTSSPSRQARVSSGRPYPGHRDREHGAAFFRLHVNGSVVRRDDRMNNRESESCASRRAIA